METFTERDILTGEEISIYLNGDWDVLDMKKYFESLHFLYNYYGSAHVLMVSPKSQNGFRALSYILAKCLGRETTIVDSEHNAWIHYEKDTDDGFAGISELKVQQINYASPGTNDLVGVGVVVGHIKDVLLKLLEMFATKETRENQSKKEQLENDRIEIENRIRELDYTKQLISTYKSMGMEEQEINQILVKESSNLLKLGHLIEDGNITFVE